MRAAGPAAVDASSAPNNQPEPMIEPTLANSSLFASLLNVKVNAKSLDAHRAESFLTQAAEIDSQAAALMTHLYHIIRERMDIHADS